MLKTIKGLLGYTKLTWSAIGRDSFGPVCCTCNSRKDAEEIAQEYNANDEYARVIAKQIKVFVEVDANTVFAKQKARRDVKQEAPEKIPTIVKSWDGTIIFFGRLTETELYNLPLGPGDVAITRRERVGCWCSDPTNFRDINKI